MNKNGFESHEEEQEWRTEFYRRVVSSEDIRRQTWTMALELRAPDDPELALADLETARRYMHKIMMTADTYELESNSAPQFAAMWAKGTLGAGRYRASKAGGGRRPRTG